ncbi:hypothetical protein MUK72_02935 [Halococcus dombrowskii]|uniref:Uncharacterized protein n=1 Tax=Halococcus dombrowskii TaxID=179637 RepID=A0AAV3SFU7_HALDO|nr:hypothetical protein [Halococcus dombrowskii]UOO95671.1 hypothetical protein MUK72_02935 [Halococcus dombrowskii]
MGSFATAVQSRLRERLAVLRPGFDWKTEHHVATTPVDVAGRADDHVALVELEWRRADPANNTAKLFRHLDEETLAADAVDVFQLFTGYYDLTSGGVSSKRLNAEFVGRIGTQALDSFRYRTVDFVLDPPKRGGDRPDDWEAATDATAREIADYL